MPTWSTSLMFVANSVWCLRTSVTRSYNAVATRRRVNSVHGRRPTPQSARRPRRVLLISSRRSSIVIESPRGACTRK